tara:strand:+ start:318 stop:569 length:252 start_codon:yes stop_codon:yes gene_type:complete
MTHFVVAIIIFLQPQMQSISIMQLPYPNKEECKNAIVKDGKNFQNDIMLMYPNANRFSLVCIDKPTINTIVEEMKRNSAGKDA